MKTPASTYRLQIRADFTLWDACRQVDYLSQLGADWLYLSPLLKAERGSDHGYDVVDPGLLDPERGGEEALAALAEQVHARGMGILVDIVPNHMGVATPDANPWWWSLLEEGPGSRYAEAFDVDWDAGGGRLLLPVLGSPGDLDALEVRDGRLHYYGHSFPLAEGTTPEDSGVARGDRARAIHDRQHYQLIDWRRADHDLNYRRFFAVNTLAGVRVEVPWVFDESHSMILRWVRAGWVDGLRIDHPDGLADPAGYLERLRDASGGAYILVEKILEPGEVLPGSMACEGTTGYDALAHIDRLFVDPAGEQPLTALDAELRGGTCDYADLVHDTKRAVADGILNSEIRRLARLVPASPALDPATVEDALAEIISNFGVYRTYLPEGCHDLARAAEAAAARRPDLARAVRVLHGLLAEPGELGRRFQQTSGMVMAKGVEDCAFYRYTRLTSLTEVGADPAIWSVSPEDFHRFMAARNAREPLGMNALSTHDTKRGEDVRARINVLAEAPGEWGALLARLRAAAPLPDGPLENLLWQAVVGAWPISRERLDGYALKAAREAGNSTAWTEPVEGFEEQLHAVVAAVHDNPEVNALITGFTGAIQAEVRANVLGAKLVQLMVPGVPDVYQGSEYAELSLTDPDNRRGVDFGELRRVLDALDAGTPTGDPGAPAHALAVEKMLVTSRALRLRRDRPDLFGGYWPLTAEGPASDHFLAFSTGGAIAAATRLPRGLADGGGWRGTGVELPYPCTDLLTGRRHDGGAVPVGELFAKLPVALLVQVTGTGTDPVQQHAATSEVGP